MKMFKIRGNINKLFNYSSKSFSDLLNNLQNVGVLGSGQMGTGIAYVLGR